MRYVTARKNIDAVIWSCCVALYVGCSTVSSASARSHTEYILLYYMLDTEMFISFRPVRCREHRCIMCSMLNCFFNLSWCLTEKTNSRIMCSMLNCFFNLRSCLTENTQTLFYYVLDAQLLLQPQIMPHWEHTNSVVLCAGCSNLSSTSAYCLTEKTHYRIVCSMLNWENTL